MERAWDGENFLAPHYLYAIAGTSVDLYDSQPSEATPPCVSDTHAGVTACRHLGRANTPLGPPFFLSFHDGIISPFHDRGIMRFSLAHVAAELPPSDAPRSCPCSVIGVHAVLSQPHTAFRSALA